MFLSSFTGRFVKILTIILMLFIVNAAAAQEIDLLIKNGHLIDPGNNIDEPMDIAIAGGKILKVAKGIP
ncbi:MAG: amidohydrolase/deacetylase family metallohydrolase, partial [Bacteroidia bacterium]|nr:amidohydrolase/deacetylase family metallohydrolase [Bacteroidia bacterium]